MTSRSPNARCPCGAGDKYKRCCRPLHRGEPAGSPERLMRSRYAAYAVGEVRYIVDTTHPDGPHWRPDRDAWIEQIWRFSRATRFVGLKVLEAGLDASGDPFVTFEAKLVQASKDASFCERSVFRMQQGRWKYFDGAPVELDG